MKADKRNTYCACGGQTKEDDTMIYCESCGFNIRKKELDSDPKAVDNPNNMN